jgi:hypothetical protein
MKRSPTYYAVIPASVRYSKLKPNAKLLYGEITALSNKEGYCFATNRYFADLYGVTKNTVSLWVSQLNKLGYVSIELIKKGEQITERRLGIIKNDATPNIINNELNTIKINTTNNISNRKEKFIEDVLKIETDQNLIKNFISYWSEENKSNTKMRFEIERTWNLKSRLQRWKSNKNKWENKKPVSKFKMKLNTFANAKEKINQINNL